MNLNKAEEAYSQKVALRLKERRLVAGHSITRLAEMAGISQSMLSYIEQGRSSPTIGMLFRIARALETSPDEILSQL